MTVILAAILRKKHQQQQQHFYYGIAHVQKYQIQKNKTKQKQRQRKHICCNFGGGRTVFSPVEYILF